MELSFREFGEVGKPAMVILHGLLGSSRNWQMAAKELAGSFRVFCLDLRNHGDSPWAEPHSYEAMVADVLGWMDANLEESPVLLGHSMGGKVAMKLACENPERVKKLVVVDISPKLYPKTHDYEFVGMREVDLEGLKSRGVAEAVLERHVPDWGLRKFLLTNLERCKDGGGFRWSINLDAIEPRLREIEKSPLGVGQRFEGDTLFVMGGKSRYYAAEDIALVKEHFPASRVEVIGESGHNPHFECREVFVELVREWVL